MILNGLRPGWIGRRRFLATAAALTACGRPKGSGFAGYAFVANEEGRSIGVVDLTTFTLHREIPLDASPSALLAHWARPVVYALAPYSGTIYEIDVPSLTLKRKARMAGPVRSMKMAPDGESIWVLNREALIRLTLDRFQATTRIKLPAEPHDFDLSSNGHAAISFTKGHAVAVADLDRGAQRVIPVSAGSGAIRFRSDGRQFLIGNRSERTITIVDAVSAKTIVRLPLPIEPENFCFADNGQMCVTGPGEDAVVIVYPYRTEVAETVLAGRAPGPMAVSATPWYLFVANPESGNVTILDIASRKVVAVVAVGAEPAYIAITPDNQYALVANRRSGDLAVIRIAAVSDRRTKAAPLFTMVPVGSKPVCVVARAV